MDSAEQATGEKRVRRVLIDPLLRRGLAKPSGLTRAQFDDMVNDMCARLAYMSETNLMALEEEAAGMAGGKEKDRFPIANKLLERAAHIQPPGDDASPLIRAVFAGQLGQDALAGGWAPELLQELRKSRRWPGAYMVKTIKDSASDSLRRLRDLDARLVRGDELTPSEDRWRASRLAVHAKCEHIAMLGRRDGGAA